MAIYLLWTALVFFLVASLLPQQYKLQRLTIGAIGWVVFAIHLGLETIHYIEISDYIMVLLMILAAFLCIIVAHFMFTTYIEIKKGNTTEDLVNDVNYLFILIKITAIGCLIYFPFAQIESLGNLIRYTVTSHTFWLSNLVGFPVERTGLDSILLDKSEITIILGCTAIESIALFIGIILGIRAELKRKIMALMASIPVIYILNLVRNTFVIGAFGYHWFGTGPMIINIFGWEYFLYDSASFYISHHIIAKIGSGIALFFISYAVLILLPEVLYLIDSLWLLIRGNKSFFMR